MSAMVCICVKEGEGVRRSGEAEWQVLILFLPPINSASTEGLNRSLWLRLWSCQGWWRKREGKIGRRKSRRQHGKRESCGNESAFNFKNSVGGWIGAFVQSLVWLIWFEWWVFIGVSELATVLRSRHVQFKSTRESYLALRSAATKEVFFLQIIPLKGTGVIWSMLLAQSTSRVCFLQTRGEHQPTGPWHLLDADTSTFFNLSIFLLT